MTERKELIERLRELAEDKVLSVNYCVAVSHAADMLEADAPAVPQEPVAWFAFADNNGPVPLELYGRDEKACKHAVLTNARSVGWKGTVEGYLMQMGWTLEPLYAVPQQRPRLTDAEIDDLAVANTLYSREVHIHSFARAIEAKIRSEQA